MKMVISRATLERERDGAAAALKAHEEGAEIHKIVLAAFEAEVAKLPPKEPEKK